MSKIEDFYENEFNSRGFILNHHNKNYNSVGTTWELKPEIGKGYYWIYSQNNLFDIKIHDFYLNKDSIFSFELPECLSITQYESISGEELSHYLRLEAGSIQTFIGGYQPYKVLIHKNIPIFSIGIEIMPEYYEEYLKKQFPDEYLNPVETFKFIDKTFDFPEMTKLLHQIKNYRGEGLAAKLFYEAKVNEAMSIIIEYKKKNIIDVMNQELSSNDIEQLKNLTAYLNDHYAHTITIDELSKIACMSRTKLQKVFKKYHSMTITAYIQQRRMSHAEYLLSNTNMNIGQIAESVGYLKASRFTELFKRSTGLLPNEYRKIAQKIENKKGLSRKVCK